ncbi:MAG: hypothetical protein JNN05_11310 [Candidatus Omnitrophica bacterium]|nr:hypothetical protein [Candidatus Omnitrophota bacterium]
MKLQEIISDLSVLGLQDNIDLATLIYLSATMAKTGYRIPVVITGHAGLGKSFLCKTVLGLFEQQNILSLSRMTFAGLIRLADVNGKVLYIHERFYDPQVEQCIRLLMSEGEVVYQIANEELKLNGPVTLLETTVNADNLGIENRSRCFVAEINSSQEVRNQICHKAKKARTISGLELESVMPEMARKHQVFQSGLDSSVKVVIPFAEQIHAETLSYHVARIISRIMNVVSAIAFINQGERFQSVIGETKYIEATIEDFELARGLLARVNIDEAELVLPKPVMEFAAKLVDNRSRLTKSEYFTHKDVMEALEPYKQPFTYKSVTKHLKYLCQVGLISDLARRGSKNSVRYRFEPEFSSRSLLNSGVNCYATLSLN